MSAPSFYDQVAAVLRDVSPMSPLVLPSTALVIINAWELDRVPIAIVERAIREKAERHARGAGARGVPLKLDWCVDDVAALFTQWKRATGAMAAGGAAPDPAALAAEHLRRARMRLEDVLKVSSRSTTFLSIVQMALSWLTVAAAPDPTGNAAYAPTLEQIDRTLVSAAFAELTPAEVLELRERVAHELKPFRDRLSGADYEKSASLKSDQLVRELLGLPTLSERVL